MLTLMHSCTENKYSGEMTLLADIMKAPAEVGQELEHTRHWCTPDRHRSTPDRHWSTPDRYWSKKGCIMSLVGSRATDCTQQGQPLASHDTNRCVAIARLLSANTNGLRHTTPPLRRDCSIVMTSATAGGTRHQPLCRGCSIVERKHKHPCHTTPPLRSDFSNLS
jgi:hypothetical protein